MTSAPGTRRSNDEWLQALRAPAGIAGAGIAGAGVAGSGIAGSGIDGSAAHAELRALIAAALGRAIGGQGSADGATLEDLTQIAMLQVLQKLDRFEGRSQFTTWVYSVAVRAAFTELRRLRQRRMDPVASDVLTAVAADGTIQPEVRSERQEIFAVLDRVIEEQLTERQRVAVRGELRGVPQADLLAQLGTNRNAFYKLLHDARQKLHAALCAAGICDDEVREAFDL